MLLQAVEREIKSVVRMVRGLRDAARRVARARVVTVGDGVTGSIEDRHGRVASACGLVQMRPDLGVMEITQRSAVGKD